MLTGVVIGATTAGADEELAVTAVLGGTVGVVSGFTTGVCAGGCAPATTAVGGVLSCGFWTTTGPAEAIVIGGAGCRSAVTFGGGCCS